MIRRASKIVNLVERYLLALELLIHRVSAFYAGVHARRNALAPKFGLERLAHAFEIFLIDGALALD